MNRPDENGERTEPPRSSWLRRVLWMMVGFLMLLSALYQARPGATGTVGEGRQRVEMEETGLLASPWFWRALWIFIGALMLLLFVYEFTVLS